MTPRSQRHPSLGQRVQAQVNGFFRSRLAGRRKRKRPQWQLPWSCLGWGAVGVVRVDMTGASMAGMVADTLEGYGGNVGDGVEIYVCHGFKCSGCAARRAGLSGSGGVEDITELLPASLGLCINKGTRLVAGDQR